MKRFLDFQLLVLSEVSCAVTCTNQLLKTGCEEINNLVHIIVKCHSNIRSLLDPHNKSWLDFESKILAHGWRHPGIGLMGQVEWQACLYVALLESMKYISACVTIHNICLSLDMQHSVSIHFLRMDAMAALGQQSKYTKFFDCAFFSNRYL